MKGDAPMEENKLEKGALYVVGTPIGNLSDFSPRAAETLAGADFIAAEDTRVTMKLLNHFGIKKPLVSYYEHNKQEKGSVIADRIAAGETCALVSDAGMPAISDPGEDLVALCAARGIRVLVVPGPSAVISALAVSGLPTGRFTFEGFLSVNKKSRQDHLQSLAGEQRTMVFYEAPHKLLNTLQDLLRAFGPDRRISLCRELTKLHEEVIRTTLQGALDYYQDLAPRGEYVLVLEGAAPPAQTELTLEDALKLVSQKVEQGLSRKDAIKQTAKETGFAKNALYDAAMKE